MMLGVFNGGLADNAALPVWLRLVFFAPMLALCLLLAAIDWRHRIIPDGCNAGVAALGLGLAGLDGLGAVGSAAVQGLVTFVLFWLFRAGYRALRGAHGLGLGDVKFLGAAGISVGLAGIAPLILIACLLALGVLAVARLRGAAITARSAIPFGPFLALGYLVVFGIGLMT